MVEVKSITIFFAMNAVINAIVINAVINAIVINAVMNIS